MEYHSLDKMNPFYIDNERLKKLSGSCKVFLVMLVTEMLQVITVPVGYQQKMFGHESSFEGVNFFLDGLSVMVKSKADTGFQLTKYDRQHCLGMKKNLKTIFDMFVKEIKHANKCNK